MQKRLLVIVFVFLKEVLDETFKEQKALPRKEEVLPPKENVAPPPYDETGEIF